MAEIVLCALGNSRARIGRLDGDDVVDARSVDLAPERLDAEIDRAIARAGVEAALVVGSVNPPAFDRLESRLRSTSAAEVYLAGRDLPITVTTALKDPSTVGHDRLLCALAAYKRAEAACIVIDAGTAITIDFIDGTGVFHGGAIAPGVRSMLAALPASCPRLPEVAWSQPDLIDGPFGRETAEAMLVGVRGAAIGLVRLLIDRYAEFYRAYPRVIATGGDAADLFGDDPVVERVVPDLQLAGLADICRQALGGDGA